MNSYLERLLGWLRAGYPQGIPSGDYIPLVALLKRRLSEEEIDQLGEQLALDGMMPADRIDVGTGYLTITDELASVEELDRVGRKLREAGWQVDDEQWRDDRGPGQAG